MMWAALWQNQQNDLCAQSDPSLCCPHEESSGPQLSIKGTAKTLIRCPGWSESLLGALAILLVLSWCGSCYTDKKWPVCSAFIYPPYKPRSLIWLSQTLSLGWDAIINWNSVSMTTLLVDIKSTPYQQYNDFNLIWVMSFELSLSKRETTSRTWLSHMYHNDPKFSDRQV